MLTVGAGCDTGRGRTLMRAFSFFVPPLLEGAGIGGFPRMGVGRTGLVASEAGGFGSGFNNGDETGTDGVISGGRCTVGNGPLVDSGAGSDMILDGGRRIGVTGGVRDGSTIRAVSRFSADGTAPACSGRGGNAMRTVSFFGSAMTIGSALRKIAQMAHCCHQLIYCSCGNQPFRSANARPDRRCPAPAMPAGRSRGCL